MACPLLDRKQWAALLGAVVLIAAAVVVYEVGKESPPAPVPDTSRTIVTEQSKWNEAVRTGTVDAYRSYLEAYPQGTHAADAQNSLGWMYRTGRGVAKDDAQAVQWYRKAADQGDVDAQNNLKVMCARGVRQACS